MWDGVRDAWYKLKDGDTSSSMRPPEDLCSISCCCLDGALILVEAGENIKHRAYDHLQSVIGGNTIIGFNDKMNTTKKSVVVMLNKAIATAEK